MTNLFADRPFNIRYAVHQHNGRYSGELVQTHRTATATWLYINRRQGADLFGPTPDWTQRGDLVSQGRCAPRRAQDPALDGMRIWQQADLHARDFRPDEPVCAHAVGSLPPGDSPADWRNLIEGFAEDFLVAQGMTTDWAIHARPGDGERDEISPHVHMLITTRVFDPCSLDVGRIRQTWLRTANARKSLAQKWWERTGLFPSSYSMAA